MDRSTLFVRNLRIGSRIFVHVEVTLRKGVRLKSQHPAMHRLSTRYWVGPPLRDTELRQRELRNDERALSIYRNGAYYLKRARLCEIGKLFSVSRQARGGVDVPSPEKHR